MFLLLFFSPVSRLEGSLFHSQRLVNLSSLLALPASMSTNVTLFEPPQLDPSKAPIENVLELTPVVDIGPV